MTRFLLILAVIALAIDAIAYSGAYSQRAWNALATGVERIGQTIRPERRPDEPRPEPPREEPPVRMEPAPRIDPSEPQPRPSL